MECWLERLLAGDAVLRLEHLQVAYQNIALSRPTKQSSDTQQVPIGYSFFAVDNLVPLDYYIGGASKTRFEHCPWYACSETQRVA